MSSNTASSSSTATTTKPSKNYLNLEEQLGFYRKYHSDPTNVLIHMFFVPTILLTTFGMTTATKLPISLSFVPATYVNLGVISALGYGIYYSLLDAQFGIPALLGIVPATIWMTTYFDAHGKTAMYQALAICTFSWIAQFFGHGVFEKRAPALLDNLVQALVLAPFFVMFEVASMLGYRKEVLEKVDKQIEGELREFRERKNKKKL